jgi:hypothetical protein
VQPRLRAAMRHEPSSTVAMGLWFSAVRFMQPRMVGAPPMRFVRWAGHHVMLLRAPTMLAPATVVMSTLHTNVSSGSTSRPPAAMVMLVALRMAPLVKNVAVVTSCRCIADTNCTDDTTLSMNACTLDTPTMADVPLATTTRPVASPVSVVTARGTSPSSAAPDGATVSWPQPRTSMVSNVKLVGTDAINDVETAVRMSGLFATVKWRRRAPQSVYTVPAAAPKVVGETTDTPPHARSANMLGLTTLLPTSVVQ